MSNITSSPSPPQPQPHPHPHPPPQTQQQQQHQQKMNIVMDDLPLNLFRLLWLIHTEDVSKLNNHKQYKMPPFNDYMNKPNELSLIQILLADSLDGNRYPMLTKGVELIMLIERTNYETQQLDPCIAYTNSASRYLSTLAHIYAYLAQNKVQLNIDTCHMIRYFVSKYYDPKKPREIKYSNFYDMGPAPTHIEYFQKITTIDRYWFGIMNFFWELGNYGELSNKIYGLHLETMGEYNLKNWYAGFGVSYFMLLHFRLVYLFYDMWTGAAAAAADDDDQKNIDKKIIPHAVQVFNSTWRHTTPQ